MQLCLHQRTKKMCLTTDLAFLMQRAGVAAKYGKWYGKIDIGYAYGKVGLKDILMQYTFNKHQLIKGGYFVHQFGCKVPQAHLSKFQWKSL